jgi:type I restriction enzyme S subunit
MTPQSFAEQFHILADAPNGVQKLREMILQLAVQGKLVPQDPKDEPASVLLEKIKTEKEQLIKEGKIRKPKPLPPIDPDQVPHKVPKGWVWTRLGNCIVLVSGQHLKPSEYNENGQGIPYLTGPAEFGDVSPVPTRWTHYRKALAVSGDVLLTVKGSGVGKTNIADHPEIAISRQLMAIRGLLGSQPYIHLYLKAMADKFQARKIGIAIPGIGRDDVNEAPFPCPPLAEQKRIVAKVDHLMALCDALETRQKERAENRITLNSACLHALTSVDGDSTKKAWQRISSNFDLLYDCPENVSALRQSILQLAVQGKLVPQNPKDEPASVLLEKIKAEKEKLIKEGKIKKQKPLPPIDPEPVPYELPEGWEWVRLVQLCALMTKGSSPKWQGVQYVDQSDGVLFITSENVGSMRMLMNKRKYVEKKFNDIEPRSILRKDDILMNIVGASIGRVAVFDLDEMANINQAVCLIRCIQPNRLIRLGYLLLFLNSDVCINYMFSKQVDMARANLSMGNIAKFAIPLPPLVEQKRIIAKVDQLMALCDELEAKLKESQSAAETLMGAVAHHLAGVG